MKTRVPETITCINCSHNVVVRLYEVDTTINSAQGHFHTLHNPTEPPYTVYCINCGHFMTNDPNEVPAKSAAVSKRPGSPPAKRPALASGRVQKQGAKAAVAGKADRRKAQVATSAAKPRQKLGQASKTQTITVSKESSPMKQPRTQRKKAK